MNEERETAQKIVQELIGYFLDNDCEETQINLTVNSEGIWLELEGLVPRKPGNLENLKTLLEVKRQPEMDDYYEHLMGMHKEQEDYSLVGMLVDSAEITCQEGLLNIRIYRENLY